jgi:hypothetical protein
MNDIIACTPGGREQQHGGGHELDGEERHDAAHLKRQVDFRASES